MAAAASDEAKTWAAANGGRVIFTRAAVPLQALSVRPETVPPSAQQKLVASLKKGNALNLAMSAAPPADFMGIASMLNTTPTSLPGAEIISAAEAKSLMANGVKIYDVRVQQEYDHGHVPGSIMVPYVESSAKEVDFDPADDNLDLTKQLTTRKNMFVVHDLLRRHNLPEGLQVRQNGGSGRLEERVPDPQGLGLSEFLCVRREETFPR